jgi:predicted alpha-1,2-mannosidase
MRWEIRSTARGLSDSERTGQTSWPERLRRSRRAFLPAMALLGVALTLPAQEPFLEVDPLAGTANDGQTVPLIGMPFAMTQWVPETRSTEDKCVAPYYYKDTQITGFRGSHWLDGSCAKEYGSFTLMPITGPINFAPSARSSAFRHETEKINPAYYAVTLDRYAERVEMTGSVRSGMMRITFPAGAAGSVLLQPNTKPGEGFVELHPKEQEIVGYNPVRRYYVGTGLPANFSGYFVARFSAPFKAQGTWCDKELEPNNPHREGGCRQLGAYASFAPGDGPLLVKIGTSFTSLDEAARNLDAEQRGWDFAAMEAKTEANWKKLLGEIEVEGGTPEERKIFYTSLYHASLVPRITSDADGTYNGFAGEGKTHTFASGDYYDDYSMWDTFRALHPLLTITDPEREQQMVESLVLKGKQGGYLPIFPLFNSYTSAMVGDHADAVIADAYAKGLRHFDVEQAYRLMLQNATKSPSRGEYQLGLGRRALPSYLKYGYIPLEDPVADAFHWSEQVSRTMEYAYDDSLVAMMARDLGEKDDARKMEKQSENWQNVFDSSVGFVRGRHADGSWVQPFEARKNVNYVTEANPWQYTFFVPQNIPGLIKAMSGEENFIAKLDGLFNGNVYDQGNEPSHHIAYLYDYAGARAKTQHEVRHLLVSQYHAGVGGLPGNDDAGQMSAWYIFSAMGFYPVTPGAASYAIGTPLFSRVTIHQPNGKTFVIEATHQSAANEYIQTQKLNGKPLEGFLLPHAEIVKGGTLSFDMGPAPAAKTMGH